MSEAGTNARILPQAPAELTQGRLRRIGEGIGKVVYASEHWVVKRERSPLEIVALIVIWRIVRRLEKFLPLSVGSRLLSRPSKRMRVLRLLTQASLLVAPKSLWFTANIRALWRHYHKSSLRGERLAEAHLAGSGLVPERITFPPTRVKIAGWPRRLTVSEATERIEATLYERLAELARQGRFDEIEVWLERFLDLRQRGWQRGLFSSDAHLKNFGVTGDRIVLLDPGGLTDRWTEVEARLAFEEVVSQPHIQLGLGPILGARPDIAGRFNARWKAVVNRGTVRQCWPGQT